MEMDDVTSFSKRRAAGPDDDLISGSATWTVRLFLSKIGGFFKDAASKLNDSILKPIGRFITKTVPTYGGEIVDSIKAVGKAVID